MAVEAGDRVDDGCLVVDVEVADDAGSGFGSAIPGNTVIDRRSGETPTTPKGAEAVPYEPPLPYPYALEPEIDEEATRLHRGKLAATSRRQTATI